MQEQNEIKILNPRLDIVFKSIFTQDSAEGRIARNSLISSLTGLDVKESQVLNNEIPLERCLIEKLIRLDLHCKTGTGETVSVEMQMNSGFYNFPNRLEYYAARLLSSVESVDDDYRNIDKVFQIMICDFTLEGKESEPLLVHTMKNQHGREFGNLMNIITLELPKIKLPKTDIGKISDAELESWHKNLTSAEKWGIFFKWADDPKKNSRLSKLFDKAKGTENARRILMQVSQREKDWAMAESRRKFVMDYTSNYNAAIRKGVEEGFRQGLEQGMQQGLEQGMQQGLEQGMQQGLEQGMQQGLEQGMQQGLEQAQAEIAQLKARIAQLESAAAN